jgi:SAM-dependent methyltransferase
VQRDQIWEVFPYPCVGEFGFLDLNLCQRPAYIRIMNKVKASPSARHLDIGCCVGQDIRRLAYDGVPSERIVGLELERGFIDLGYDLFRDRDKIKSQFVVANMLDENNDELDSLAGSFDTIHVGMVIQLFNRDEQMKFLAKVFKLGKEEPGVLIVGHFLGHTDAAEDVPGKFGQANMRHNLESWFKLWNEVCEKTGTRWRLETTIDTLVGFGPRHSTWRDPKWRRLVFEAERA